MGKKFGSMMKNFAFVDDVSDLMKDMKLYLLDGSSQVPRITVNLANTEGKYNYGGNAFVLDLTWYARYKPTVDKVVVAFVYIAFIFLVFKRLPEIINGSGAITDKGMDISQGFRQKGGKK